MKKLLFLFCFFPFFSLWAYVPDAAFLERTDAITQKMNRAIGRMARDTQSHFVQSA